ncbi:hypothetical protein A2307_04500 [Candidatus Peregrinibacteria bacterium RIFOXYB2_FULL_33_20]|nr:MAG: hypothetical protein A2307_04500 [Candidatus Peregrinibacteria bacterium RIFOXYB2_FULL_33_20]
MFCDEAKITVIGGKGGDGHVSFHREKFIAKGGPDGGDGGHGGNIIFLAVENVNTLSDFRTRKKFKAQDGENGGKCDMTGAHAEDLILKVPVGTIILQALNNEVLADLCEINQMVVMAKGGIGGHGNANFASSIRQAPNFAELGEPGEEKELILDLKLVADVGIIGIPSAGKSTLISRISNSRPKIADYPFTTLVPNLGVVDLKVFGAKESESFVVVDVPGLIEGANEGKGLGHKFLRHVSRAVFLVHLLDIASNDVLENYAVINEELKKYSKILAKKQQIVVLNKIDLVDKDFVDFISKELEKMNPKLKGKVKAVSAVTGEGLRDLVFTLWGKINELKIKNEKGKMKENKLKMENGKWEMGKEKTKKLKNNLEFKLYQPHLDHERDMLEIKMIGKKKVLIENRDVKDEVKERLTKKQRMARQQERAELRLKKRGLSDEEFFVGEDKKSQKTVIQIFEVRHKRLEQLVKMTNFANEEGVARIYDILKKMRIDKALHKNGAKAGDKIIIAGKELKVK